MRENAVIALEKVKKNASMILALPRLKLQDPIRMRNGQNPEMNRPAFLADMCKSES